MKYKRNRGIAKLHKKEDIVLSMWWKIVKFLLNGRHWEGDKKWKSCWCLQNPQAKRMNEHIGQFKVESGLRNRCRLWRILPYYNDLTWGVM